MVPIAVTPSTTPTWLRLRSYRSRRSGARTARPNATAACEVCAIVPTARTSHRRRTSAATQRVLVPARAPLEAALRLQERLHVGTTEQHRGLGVPREHGSLGDAGEEQLHDRREPLDIRLLLDHEAERAVGNEREVVGEKVVTAALDLAAQAEVLDRLPTGERADPVDREDPAGLGLAVVGGLDHRLLLLRVAGESDDGRGRRLGGGGGPGEH